MVEILNRRKLLLNELRQRAAPDTGRMVKVGSVQEFTDAVAHNGIVCIIFSAKWCGPWRMIKPDVLRLAQMHNDVDFYEVDIDDNVDIALARHITVAPTFMFFKCGVMIQEFSEPNRLKLDETLRKARKIEIKTKHLPRSMTFYNYKLPSERKCGGCKS